MKSFVNKHLGICLSLSLLSYCAAQSQAAVSETSKDSPAFARLADQFMKDSLALVPSTASQAGYHKHVDKAGKEIELDAVLDDVSSVAYAKQKTFYEEWQQRLRKDAPLASLSEEDAADWRLIDDQISLSLLELDKIQNYRHNPALVVEMIGSALFQPLTEDYAPKEKRLSHIISRIGQIPRALSDVKTYLTNSNEVYVKSAIDENDGNIELIENTIKAEIQPGSAQMLEYDKVAPLAVAALKDYKKWLETYLSKQPCDRSWRLGDKLYQEKFRYVMESDHSPAQVLADAESDLKSVRAEMLKLALPMHKKMYPEHSEHSDLKEHAKENQIIGEVLKKISDEHPKREDLQKAIEADLEGIKAFIREKKIVALSDRDNLKVVPTPVFQRAVLSVAAFHSAPALNPKAEAQYWVTPIDSSVSNERAESKLREYNNFTLKWLTIHEALPGHYIQFEHLNDLKPEWRRLLRSLCGNGAYIEGWAEYIAQVMMDEGYMADDQRFRMIMKKIRLRLLCNAILDIKMHTQNMSDKEALDLMMVDGFQTQAEAEGKLRRAQLTSTQLPTYYVGVREWLSFRKKYQAAAGGKFDMLNFHNMALDEGPLSVPAVEKIMMDRLKH